MLGMVPDASMTRETPRLAPEVIPKTSGPARGFRKRVCMSRPLAASAEPARTAVTALGIRIFPMILAVPAESTSIPKTALRTSWMEIWTGPTAMSKMKRTMANRSKQENLMALLQPPRIEQLVPRR
jgi:hypothetical protein